jgi:O-antigen/teichoic acid export membrane protein
MIRLKNKKINNKQIRQLKNPLYRNGILLILNSIVLSGLGFLFWAIVVRIYSARDVGLATTLLSSIELICNLSLLGFNIALIRYLSQSKEKNKMIGSCFMLSGFIALTISTIFILGLNSFSPKLLFLKETKLYIFLFILFTISYVLFTLIDSVFIAYRKVKFVVLKNIIFGLLKLMFPFLLIVLGAFGILISVEISGIIALIISLIIGFIYLNIKIALKIKKEIIKNMLRFSIGNYISNTLLYAPSLVLPLIITNLINPETTAYFYLSIMLAGLLFIIPYSISQSLLAEGSHNPRNIKQNIKKSFRFSYLILIPAALILMILGKYLLLLFGKTYSDNAFMFLQLLVLSSIFYAINIIYIAIKNIQHQIRKVIIISFFISAATLLSSYILINLGLVGIGISYILGQILGNCFVFFDVVRTGSLYGK